MIPMGPRVADLLGGYGMAGVQIFFVISGYVITRGLLATSARAASRCGPSTCAGAGGK